MSLLHITNNSSNNNINNDIYDALHCRNVSNIFKNHNIHNEGVHSDINNNNIKINNNNNCNYYISDNANNNNCNNNLKNNINNNINNSKNNINIINNNSSPEDNNLPNIGHPINCEHPQTKMNECLEVNKTISPPHSTLQAHQHKLTTSWWNYYHNLYISWYRMTFNPNITFNTNFDPEVFNKLIPLSPLYSNGVSSFDKYRKSSDENRCNNFCDDRYNECSRFNYRVSGQCADEICKLRTFYNHQSNRRPTTMFPPDLISSETSQTQLGNLNDNHIHNNKTDIRETPKKKHSRFSNKPVNWMLPDETTTNTTTTTTSTTPSTKTSAATSITTTSITTTLPLPASNVEHKETNEVNDEMKQCKEMKIESHQILPLLPLVYFKDNYQPVATHPRDICHQWSLPPHADVPPSRHPYIRPANNYYSNGYLFKENFSKAIDTSKSEYNYFLPTSSSPSSAAAFLSSSSSLLATTSPLVSQRRVPDCSTSPQPASSHMEHFGNSTSKHSPPPRFHCDACNKSYSTYNGLSKHKEFHCSRYVKKQFTCPHCECKSYASLGALKMHIRTHTLPCKCKLCGKAFSRPWLLQGHLRTHTGERPFGCPHCCRAFADRSNLRAHMQTHSDVKKYNCNKCGKTFSRMSLLHKHRENNIC